MGLRRWKSALGCLFVLSGCLGSLGWLAPSASHADPMRPRADRNGSANASKSGRLRPVATLRCPPAEETTEPLTTSALRGGAAFVARDRFRENVSARDDVSISWLGAGFSRRYLAKIEPPHDAASLHVFVLDRPLRSAAIAEMLHHPYETRLAGIWCLLRLQPNGTSGALSVDATSNLFFVRDAAGMLGVVDVLWSGVGWEIGASTLARSRPWPQGRHLITR